MSHKSKYIEIGGREPLALQKVVGYAVTVYEGRGQKFITPYPTLASAFAAAALLEVCLVYAIGDMGESRPLEVLVAQAGSKGFWKTIDPTILETLP